MNSYAINSQPTPHDIPSRDQVADSRRHKRAEFLDLLRRRWPHPCVIGVALAISELLSFYPLVQDADSAPINLWAAMVFIWGSLPLLLVMLVATSAQVWLPQRVGLRRALLIFAAVAISVAIPAFQGHRAQWGITGLDTPWGHDPLPVFLFLFWIDATFTVLLVILYEWQLRTDQAVTAVRDARIADEALATQVLDARLNGMKARVDPEFLFAVIAHAEVLYAEEVDRGERLLDQLIEFLRATLPRSTGSRAAVGSEVRLCEAYLGLETSMRRGSMSYETTAERTALAARFPPTVLLPLLKALLPPRLWVPVPAQFASLPEERSALQPIVVSVSVWQDSLRLGLDISCHATARSALALPAVSQHNLATANTALQAFFGKETRVETRARSASENVVSIEVPYLIGAPHVAT